MTPTYEYECSNQLCEANLHIDREVSHPESRDVECPICYDSMNLVYANAEV